MQNFVVRFCVSLGINEVFLGCIWVHSFSGAVQTTPLKCTVSLVHISLAAMLTHITESSR